MQAVGQPLDHVAQSLLASPPLGIDGALGLHLGETPAFVGLSRGLGDDHLLEAAYSAADVAHFVATLGALQLAVDIAVGQVAHLLGQVVDRPHHRAQRQDHQPDPEQDRDSDRTRHERLSYEGLPLGCGGVGAGRRLDLV